MIAARDNFTQSLFLDISHNKLSCHIKILSVLAQEQQKLESDILYPINVFSGLLTILSIKEEWFKRNCYLLFSSFLSRTCGG